MGMGFAPTCLRQVSPPASQNHFNHQVHHVISTVVWLIRNICLSLSIIVRLSVYL